MCRFMLQSHGFVFASLIAVACLTAAGAPARAQTSRTQNPPSQASIASAAPKVRATADTGYRLDTGDRLHIIVFGEPDLSGDYDVDGSGYIRLPLVGQLKTAGLTLVEVEDKLQSKLAAGYLKNPKISVDVINYRPFYIIGEVNKPGEYSYASGMNVLTAVALAGGFTYRADDSDVYIRHKGSTDEVSEPADQTTQVKPGDIIRVAERFF